jgi:hypothetical protein
MAAQSKPEARMQLRDGAVRRRPCDTARFVLVVAFVVVNVVGVHGATDYWWQHGWPFVCVKRNATLPTRSWDPVIESSRLPIDGILASGDDWASLLRLALVAPLNLLVAGTVVCIAPEALLRSRRFGLRIVFSVAAVLLALAALGLAADPQGRQFDLPDWLAESARISIAGAAMGMFLTSRRLAQAAPRRATWRLHLPGAALGGFLIGAVAILHAAGTHSKDSTCGGAGSWHHGWPFPAIIREGLEPHWNAMSMNSRTSVPSGPSLSDAGDICWYSTEMLAGNICVALVLIWGAHFTLTRWMAARLRFGILHILIGMTLFGVLLALMRGSVGSGGAEHQVWTARAVMWLGVALTVWAGILSSPGHAFAASPIASFLSRHFASRPHHPPKQDEDNPSATSSIANCQPIADNPSA